MSKVFNMVGGGGVTASISVAGLSQTDIVTATNGSKTKIGVWTQIPNPAIVVPDGYTQLEYIESTGTQYIQVPAPTVTNGFIVEFSFYSGSQPSGYYPLFVSLASNGFWLGWLNGSFIVRMADNKDVITTSFTTNKWIDAKVVYDGSTVKLFFDGNQVGSAKATFANGGVNTYFCYDLANNTSFRLGEFEFSVGGTVIYHYVPCKNGSGSVGLYDLVNSVFYTNAGTGTFTAGPEIPQTIDGFLIKPIRDFGTWTVTATDGTKTATQDVLVDVITKYEIEMSLSA